MRYPTPRMTPNTVRIRRQLPWTRDVGAGRKLNLGLPSLPVRCAVQPTSAEDKPDHMREAEVIYHTLKFYDDPRLKIRDQINFGDRILVVTGVRATSGGAGRTWVVLAEERPGGMG